MLIPSKVKYRKVQKKRTNNKKTHTETRGTKVSFGSYGLKSLAEGKLKSNQIEAARRCIVRSAGKTAKFWIRIFPDRPFTKKPSEVKMGKGKGDVEGFEFKVMPGRVIFELDNVSKEIATLALNKAGSKLPVKTKVVSRE